MERRIIMKFMSWNVNGLRAALRHGFVNTFTDLDADIFGIQDTRVEPNEVKLIYQDTINIGIMLKERVMPELQYLQKKNQLLWLMASVFQKLMVKEEVLL